MPRLAAKAEPLTDEEVIARAHWWADQMRYFGEDHLIFATNDEFVASLAKYIYGSRNAFSTVPAMSDTDFDRVRQEARKLATIAELTAKASPVQTQRRKLEGVPAIARAAAERTGMDWTTKKLRHWIDREKVPAGLIRQIPGSNRYIVSAAAWFAWLDAIAPEQFDDC